MQWFMLSKRTFWSKMTTFAQIMDHVVIGPFDITAISSENRVRTLKTNKTIGSNVLNCCPKITTANLHKIGLKMRE